MNPEKRITQARVALLLDYPFFGNLALHLKLVEKSNMFMPTMATDGRCLYYDPNWVMEISLPELMGVIAHEVMHIVLWHLARRQSREPLRWNLATDYAVNDQILTTTANISTTPQGRTLTLPQGTLYDKKYTDQTAEWIYNQIPETKIKVLVTIDSHEEWSEWGNGGDGKGERDGQNTGKSEGDGEPKPGDLSTDDLEQEWRENIAQAATQARMAGKLPSNLETLVGEILNPQLDWRSILRDMVVSCAKSNFRIAPPSKKHLWRGYYLPAVTGEEINIAVGIDSSGSISDDEIKEFMSEVKGICDNFENYTIHLLICDAAIHQRYELHQFDPLPASAQGRGGTSYKPVFEEVKKLEVSTLIYLTDLYPNDGFPEPLDIPVIWVATPGTNDPPYGQTIRLPERR